MTMTRFHNFLEVRQVSWTRRVPRAQTVMEDKFMHTISMRAIYRELLMI
jgi:hypothetical protein